MDKLEKSIKDISNNHYIYLMNLENVNGVAYGYKYINNKNTFEPCINVLVENKIHKNYLTKNNVIPKTYMGIKTDVVEIGEIALSNAYTKTRPLNGGAAIGIYGEEFRGTMCCIVKKKVKISRKNYSYDYYILTNNHVLAQNGQIPLGSLVIQPVVKLNNETTKLGSIVAITGNFIRIKTPNKFLNFPNFVDCCIAKIIDKSFISNKVLGLTSVTGVTKAKLGMIVNKSASTTGIKQGKITALHATHNIPFPFNKNEAKSFFINQIDVDIKTMEGDSGAPILTVDGKLVGMNMGANKTDTLAICNDINDVFFYLNVQPYLGEELL